MSILFLIGPYDVRMISPTTSIGPYDVRMISPTTSILPLLVHPYHVCLARLRDIEVHCIF
jgi:hypothetical protein